MLCLFSLSILCQVSLLLTPSSAEPTVSHLPPLLWVVFFFLFFLFLGGAAERSNRELWLRRSLQSYYAFGPFFFFLNQQYCQHIDIRSSSEPPLSSLQPSTRLPPPVSLHHPHISSWPPAASAWCCRRRAPSCFFSACCFEAVCRSELQTHLDSRLIFKVLFFFVCFWFLFAFLASRPDSFSFSVMRATLWTRRTRGWTAAPDPLSLFKYAPAGGFHRGQSVTWCPFAFFFF